MHHQSYWASPPVWEMSSWESEVSGAPFSEDLPFALLLLQLTLYHRCVFLQDQMKKKKNPSTIYHVWKNWFKVSNLELPPLSLKIVINILYKILIFLFLFLYMSKFLWNTNIPSLITKYSHRQNLELGLGGYTGSSPTVAPPHCTQTHRKTLHYVTRAAEGPYPVTTRHDNSSIL